MSDVNLDQIDPAILANATGVLATLGPVGAPQLTIVWFIVQDNQILISVNGNRQKVRNVQSNSAVSFLIAHPDTDAYFAEIRGTAQLIADSDYDVADQIAVKYAADFRTFDRQGDARFIVRITPKRVLITDVRH